MIKANIDYKLVIAGTGAIILLYALGKREAQKTAVAVGEAVNPTSEQNVFYRGVNAVGETLTGNKDFDLGRWIYDKTNN